LKLGRKGLVNEKRKILPSKESGAGGVLARTIGRALSNLNPSLVAGWRGLLCRHFGGVWIMKDLEQFLNVEAEWVLERLSTGTESNDRNYYQGRLDQLAQVRRFLGQPQIMRERASK